MPKYFYFCPTCHSGFAHRATLPGRVKTGSQKRRAKYGPVVYCGCSKPEVKMEGCGSWPKGLEEMRRRKAEARQKANDISREAAEDQ